MYRVVILEEAENDIDEAFCGMSYNKRHWETLFMEILNTPLNLLQSIRIAVVKNIKVSEDSLSRDFLMEFIIG